MNPIIQQDFPSGPSLAEQARLVATARVNEFQPVAPATQTRRPAEFPLGQALRAIAGQDTVRQVQATLALQEFMEAPARASEHLRGRLHEMVAAGDMSTVNNSARDYIDQFLLTPAESDDGWRQIFRTHGPMEAEQQNNKSGFRVLNVESGIVFKKRKPGEAVEFRSVKGTDQFVVYESFGGGVGIERIWWDDQDYITIGDLLVMFREGAYSQQADDMYGLLTALATTYNYSTGTDLIAKLNGAAADIIRGLQGKGVGVNSASTFLIVCAVEKIAEVKAALATISDVAMQTAASKQKLVFNFKVVGTVRVPVTGAKSGVYVGLPGGRCKAGIRQDLTLYGQFNIARYADDLAGFLRYAGYLEATQWRRIP